MQRSTSIYGLDGGVSCSQNDTLSHFNYGLKKCLKRNTYRVMPQHLLALLNDSQSFYEVSHMLAICEIPTGYES